MCVEIFNGTNFVKLGFVLLIDFEVFYLILHYYSKCPLTNHEHFI